jgi:hypothetical protein
VFADVRQDGGEVREGWEHPRDAGGGEALTMMAEMSRLTFGELVGNFCGGATAVWTLRTATFGILDLLSSLQILFRFCWTCSHPAQANRQKKEPPRRKITEPSNHVVSLI